MISEAMGEEVAANLTLLDARAEKLRSWDAFEAAAMAYKSALWKVFDDYENASERAAEDAAYGRLVEAVEKVKAAREKELEGYQRHSEAIAKLRAAVAGEED